MLLDFLELEDSDWTNLYTGALTAASVPIDNNFWHVADASGNQPAGTGARTSRHEFGIWIDGVDYTRSVRGPRNLCNSG